MWLFKKRKQLEYDRQREAAIQAYRKQTSDSIDKASESTEKLNKELESTTYLIFLATGGDRRSNDGR